MHCVQSSGIGNRRYHYAQIQYVKMKVISDVKGKTLVEFVQHYIEPGATISSDAYRSFNAKAFIGGTFHGLAPKHLQLYGQLKESYCIR